MGIFTLPFFFYSEAYFLFFSSGYSPPPPCQLSPNSLFRLAPGGFFSFLPLVLLFSFPGPGCSSYRQVGPFSVGLAPSPPFSLFFLYDTSFLFFGGRDCGVRRLCWSGSDLFQPCGLFPSIQDAVFSPSRIFPSRRGWKFLRGRTETRLLAAYFFFSFSRIVIMALAFPLKESSLASRRVVGFQPVYLSSLLFAGVERALFSSSLFLFLEGKGWDLFWFDSLRAFLETPSVWIVSYDGFPVRNFRVVFPPPLYPSDRPVFCRARRGSATPFLVHLLLSLESF